MFLFAPIVRRFIAKLALSTVCLYLTLSLLPLPSYALTVKNVPNPQKEDSGWVTDMAGLLSPATEAKLNQIISELKRQTGDEIVVVTVPETTPAPNPKAFTRKLFNYWDIDRNGMLLLVSKSDRRVEIQAGYGIESLLPDAQLSNIIQKEIIPQFKQGNVEGGILAGIKSLFAQLGGNLAVDAIDTNATAKFNPQSGYVALTILLIGLFVLPSFWWFSSISRRSGITDISSSELGSNAGDKF